MAPMSDMMLRDYRESQPIVLNQAREYIRNNPVLDPIVNDQFLIGNFMAEL